MTIIKQENLIGSIVGALQYNSYYHPANFISHLAHAYLASKTIKTSKVLAFAHLKIKTIYEFDVHDMPVTVAVDSNGASAHTTVPANGRQRLATFRL